MRQAHSRQARELRTFCGLMNLRRGDAAFCLCLASIVASPLLRNKPTAHYSTSLFHKICIGTMQFREVENLAVLFQNCLTSLF
jgi:hypothetical protein